MCICSKPNINGQPGYSPGWSKGITHTHPVDPPTLEPGDHLIYDEPGRCMKVINQAVDFHSYHFQIIGAGTRLFICGKQGLSTVRIPIHSFSRAWLTSTFLKIGSNDRFVFCKTLYDVYKQAEHDTAECYVRRYNEEQATLDAGR